MTRGLGWAMEELLATHRLDTKGRWLHLAVQMGEHLLKAQTADGSWAFQSDQPVAKAGVSEKGTALWSLLFDGTYAGSKDPRHLTAARRALTRCIDNQYTGPDPEAHGGVVGVSPHSAVGHRACIEFPSLFGSRCGI
jgi:hypothetical protein